MRDIKISSYLYENLENLSKSYKFDSVDSYINFLLSWEVSKFYEIKDIIEQNIII